MNNNKTPRHLAERVAAELLPDTLAGLDRPKAERLNPVSERDAQSESSGASVALGRDRSGGVRAVPGSERASSIRSITDLPKVPAKLDLLAVPPRPEIRPTGRTGEIVSRKTMEEAGMVVARGRRDQAGEEFRIVRQHILQSIGSAERKPEDQDGLCPNVVMVTSAKHGEGKSFMSLNLANILAEGGDRPVVLIDADIGDNSLSRHFGLESRPGLLDLAVSPRQLANATVIPTEPENLSFIPIGGGADGAIRGDLSSRQPVRNLIQRLAAQFPDSILVVDSPACLSNSDPMELASVVGQIVLVVEAGQTRRKDIEGALDLIDACPNISLVLNRMSKRGRGSFAL